jgi:hypothetical protein
VVALNLTFNISKRTAALILLSEFVAFLFVIINFMRTYHERIRDEGFDEWTHTIQNLGMLYSGKAEGFRLIEMYRANHPNMKALLENWNKVVASYVSRIGKDYKREFYEGSRTGEYLPDDDSQWEQWVRDRINKLNGFIEEVEQPPPQLISNKDRLLRQEHFLGQN